MVSTKKSDEIIEQSMRGMRTGIPKEETYKKYGDAARIIEIRALGKHDAFDRVGVSEIPGGVAVMEGRFV